LQQNGLKFGMENRRGNWNSLIRGCRVLVISPLLLLCLRTWPTACPSHPSCQKPPTSHHGARGSGRAGGVRVRRASPERNRISIFSLQRRVELPVGVDVTEEHEAGYSLPGQYASRYMCAIIAAFVPSPTGTRLDLGEYQLTLRGDAGAMFCLGFAR